MRASVARSPRRSLLLSAQRLDMPDIPVARYGRVDSDAAAVALSVCIPLAVAILVGVLSMGRYFAPRSATPVVTARAVTRIDSGRSSRG